MVVGEGSLEIPEMHVAHTVRMQVEGKAAAHELPAHAFVVGFFARPQTVKGGTGVCGCLAVQQGEFVGVEKAFGDVAGPGIAVEFDVYTQTGAAREGEHAGVAAVAPVEMQVAARQHRFALGVFFQFHLGGRLAKGRSQQGAQPDAGEHVVAAGMTLQMLCVGLFGGRERGVGGIGRVGVRSDARGMQIDFAQRGNQGEPGIVYVGVHGGKLGNIVDSPKL